MPVTVVENVLRVRMLPGTNAMADDWKATLRVPLLADAAWGSGGGGLAGRDHMKAVSGYLESIGKDGSAERVCLRAGDIDRFIDAVCPKPEPCLKNTIPASSHTFQNVKNINIPDDLLVAAGMGDMDRFSYRSPQLVPPDDIVDKEGFVLRDHGETAPLQA